MPHFDHGCSSWSYLLKKTLKIKLFQNKCIRFCLNVLSRSHIHPFHFGKTSRLPSNDTVECCFANTVFMYWDGVVPEMRCLSLHSADMAQDHR